MITINPNFIVTVLILIIVTLILAVIWLNVLFYNEKKQYKIELEIHQKRIAEMSRQLSKESNNIILAEAIDETLQSANNKLSRKISALNFELFEILSKNNLLKK